jgi:histidinol-phosphate aminotransferase
MSLDFFRPEIVQMRGYVPGEQPQAGKFIKLNTNENPYPPSAAVGRAIQAAWNRGLARYPDPVATAFRLRAAQLHGVEPDWILCGNGSDEILTILTRSLVGSGDWLRLPYPSYVLYKNLAEIQGANSEEVHFRKDWTLGPEFSDARHGLRLAMLPNPNSPSGTVLTPGTILELAQRLPCPLLVDEAYADFAEENCVPLVAKSEKTLVSRTLSKSYALAGLRFGYLVAQPQLIEQFLKVKDSYNCDALSIAAATAAIDDQAWLHDTRRKIILTRERVTRELRRLAFSVVDSHANFVWCTHETAAAQSLYEGLKQRQILVRYMNYPGWGDGIRVSVGTDEQMDTFLSVLESLL